MYGREVIGVHKPEMLIADASFPLNVVTVTVSGTKENVLTLERGSVLAMDKDTGKCRLLSGAEGETAAYILAEPVMTSEDDAVGVAYETGKFIKQSLIVADNYELSVRDLKDLRDAGILVENALM